MESTAPAISVIIPILVMFFMGSIALAFFAFWIWMLIDCAKNEPDEGNNKLIWILIIVFTQLIGALIYYFVQRAERLKKQKETPTS